MNTTCKLCEKKRARRYCPGVQGEICAACCGTERENTIDCPLDCEHLREARRRQPAIPLTAENLPNLDVQLDEDFVRKHEHTLMWLTLALARAMDKERAVDSDTREALEALIRTYRTLESGLIYETRPENPYAAAIQQALKSSVEELRKNLAEETGMQTLRDADILGVLVFLQRLERQHSNGRRRGRAFFDFLTASFPMPEAASPALSMEA